MRSKKFFKAEQASLVWDVPGLVAGVDEAGRGPLAGPVVAAAVILDERKPIRGLADSKQLTAKRREKLYDALRAKALCCSIAMASVEEIDRLNILQHPEYGFDRHKGYGTVVHLQALQTHGALPEHRRSFAPVARVLATTQAKP
jgi:ribonuclease HII